MHDNAPQIRSAIPVIANCDHYVPPARSVLLHVTLTGKLQARYNPLGARHDFDVEEELHVCDEVVDRLQSLLGGLRTRIDAYLRWCESPIERLLLLAFLERVLFVEAFGTLSFNYLSNRRPGVPTIHDEYLGSEAEPLGIDWLESAGHPNKSAWVRRSLVPQYTVTDELGDLVSRVDFAFFYHGFSSGEEIKIAIECDGHDFHDRTAQQAQRDRSKDRRLQSLGWLVARYTGSEIVKDAESVVSDITSLAMSKDEELFYTKERGVASRRRRTSK